jgi:hypothetical protein
MTVLNEPSTPSLWKAGRITGWREALMENSLHTFRSLTSERRMTVLQEVYKEKVQKGGKRANDCPFPL